MKLEKYRYLFCLSIKKMRIYKMDFVLNFLSIFIWIGVGVFNICMLFYKTNSIGDWSKNEVLLLYGMWTITFAMYNIIGSGLLDIENYIITGNLDTVLVKPINPLIQILFSRINVMGIAFWITGFITIMVALSKLHMKLNLVEMIYLFISVISGGVLIYSIFWIIASLAFWINKSSRAIKVGYDIHKFVQYPIDIYNKGFRLILSTVLPFAFTDYYPIACILHKVSYKFGVLSFLVTVTVFCLAYMMWKIGLRKYEGSGA